MPRTQRFPPQSKNICEAHSEPNVASIPASENTGERTNLSSRAKRQRRDDSSPLCTEIEQLKDMLLSWKSEQATVLMEHSNTLKTIVADIAELKTQSRQIQNTNSEIEKAIEFFNSNFEDVQRRIELLERERTQYKQEFEKLENRLQDFEFGTRSACIEIRNIPHKEKETTEELLKIVKQVGSEIQFDLQPDALRDIYRLPGKPNTSRPIIAEFRSVVMKTRFIASVRSYNKGQDKEKKMNSAKLGLNCENRPIYISEYLSLSLKKLFHQAREFAKQHNYKFCWYTNGKIFLRKLEDVEGGIPEDEEYNENRQPLLGDDGRHISRIRPPRPRHLGLSDTTQNPPRALPKLILPDMTPSSVSSTVHNSPVGDTGSTMSKPWRRGDRRLRRLNTELLEAIDGHDVEEVERLLNAGANPNATCRLDLVSACHIAAIAGGDALSLLVKFGAEKLRIDRLGRTPLHLAALAGNARHVAILLEFPEDMQDRVGDESMSSETEDDVRKLCPYIREMTNVRCDLGEVNMILPKTWKDNIDHECRDIKGTLNEMFQPGWTPLHVASSCIRRHCTRLLLAAGADPNICDAEGRTALDVIGSAFYYNKDLSAKHLPEVIKMLLKAGGRFNTMKRRGSVFVNTPLHTAVELENLEAIRELLDAGASINCLNKDGLTPLHVCVKKELEEYLQVLANYDYINVDPMLAVVDVKDKEGHTVLQAAVEAAWVPGVCIALEAGADVTLKANDGETPIHSAAALGNIDVLNEILSVAKQKDALDYQNEEGETALYKAIIHGRLECVKQILNEGASLKIMLPGDVNVLHVAADYGELEILKVLLDHDEAMTDAMINALTAGDRRGFGPIHFAVSNNHAECVKILLSKKADVRLRTTCSPHRASTPLHIAAVKNHVDIAKILVQFDKTIIYEVNNLGWFPLHTASHHGCRDVITLLLKEGADLSGHTDGPKKYKRTAIDMIINNLPKPTEFMEEVFDSYISSNGHDLQDPSCVICVDYGILMPSVCEMEQMKVIEALLKTGNRHGQKKLLVHPLVESFLYLKWKALLPFFYAIIGLYGFFVMSLTVFIVSVFFYRDTKDTAPKWLDSTIWSYVVYITISLILLQEFLYMNVKSSRYFLQLETWVKFGSLGLAVILPYAVIVVPLDETEWPRHVATLALLLSWLEMMFLLSRFPNWGYYVLMFGKVASNVIKILLTFAFLVIGFSLSFMIQFRSQIPFEGPWAAFVKTIVMMTSEFDYVALFDEEHSKELATSLIIVRLIFLVFLILAAIVLMNLLVGVAVNDINDLEVLGNIRRIAKQVEFLSTLDTLVYNKLFNRILPKRVNNRLKNKRKVHSIMTLSPGKPRWRYSKVLPSRIKDAIFNTAQFQKKQMDDEKDFQRFNNMMDEIHEIIVKERKDADKHLEIPDLLKDKVVKKGEDIAKRLAEIDETVADIKNQTKSYVEESKSSVEILNVKVDQMSLEIEVIKQFLSRIESKIGR